MLRFKAADVWEQCEFKRGKDFIFAMCMGKEAKNARKTFPLLRMDRDRRSDDRRGPRPERRFFWTQEMEDRLRRLVEQQKESPDWKTIAQEFGMRPSAVQNKYTSLTEPRWDRTEENFIFTLYQKAAEKAESVAIGPLCEQMNAELKCNHTERGCMLMLERITKNDRRPYRLEREARPERQMRDDMAPIFYNLEDALRDAMRRNYFGNIPSMLRETADKVEQRLKQDKPGEEGAQ